MCIFLIGECPDGISLVSLLLAVHSELVEKLSLFLVGCALDSAGSKGKVYEGIYRNVVCTEFECIIDIGLKIFECLIRKRKYEVHRYGLKRNLLENISKRFFINGLSSEDLLILGKE